MKRHNWYWDINIPFKKIKTILSREDDPRFPGLAGTLLSRVSDTKQVFELITPAAFCRRYRAIENEIKSDEWTKEKAAFWKATYLRLSKELRKKGEKLRKPAAIELDDQDRSTIEKIKQLRKAKIMSQAEFAHALGYSQQYISGIEKGREKASPDFMKKVIDFSKQTDPCYEIQPIAIKNIEKFAGFAQTNARSGENCLVLVKDSLTSDDERFYTYMDGISKFLSKYVPLSLNSIYQFLLVMHEDGSASLYMNELPLVKIEIRAKRPIAKGEFVRNTDIADVRRVLFEGVDLKKTDNIIYCFKVGWKFGLYFDLQRRNEKSPHLDVNTLSLELGRLYRCLAFENVYKFLASKDHFEQLVKYGWFPFIALIGNEFDDIFKLFQNPLDFENKINSTVNKFDAKRIDSITQKWWNHPIFKEKQSILNAGIKAYLQDSKEGIINCIKTLLPEIEGIMRHQHFLDKGFDSNKSEQLIKHAAEKAEIKAQSKYSLFCISHFAEYLQKVIFPNFDLATDQVALSRHTSSHGLAKSDQYTKVRALQCILILDQIYFYIN